MKSLRRLGQSPRGQTTLKLFGIFGHPLNHTLSPVFQEAGFEKAGIPAQYLVFDLSPSLFKKTLRSIKEFPLQGFNVTVPYKQTVMPYLDWITDSARAIGAVNTVYRFGKKWLGTNTDAEGFWLSLKKEWNFRAEGKNILVLGAGGAARAVIYALAAQGAASVEIRNRTRSRAQKIARDFSKIFKDTAFFAEEWSPGSQASLAEFDLIVNSTSVGMHARDHALVRAQDMPSSKNGKKYFVDLIYNPAETPFLKSARKKGHFTLNGLPMLLYQGTRAFEIWTGKKPPENTMRSALEQALKNR